jgi:2-oxoglutarate ferredoxin oxidoreductase subunit beta
MSQSKFTTSNEVRWCPGCGDYAILAAMQRFLPTTGLKPENVVFVSGIGCAGRFPYYMNTYGFHVIHGRAPAVATGIKLMRPDLSVWLVTGDGDGLSIGAGHFVHALRRDLDINILLLNNQVYGLTKGQISPTSPIGQKTKTTPQGGVTRPINPIQLALASGATFIARGLDKDPKHLAQLFKQASEHRGTSLIEIYQNCPIFNDGAFHQYDSKVTREQQVIYLDDQQPLKYGGKAFEKYLSLHAQHNPVLTDQSVLATTHDIRNPLQAHQLAGLDLGEYPLPLGVYYRSGDTNQPMQSAKVAATMDDVKKLLL